MPQQAHVLDAPLQAVVDHLVAPIDQEWELLAVPTQPPLIAFDSCLQMNAQPRGVGLALDRVQAPALAAKAYTPGLAHTDPVGRLVGTDRQLLGHEAVDMRSRASWFASVWPRPWSNRSPLW
jgi:hypothetical protein